MAISIKGSGAASGSIAVPSGTDVLFAFPGAYPNSANVTGVTYNSVAMSEVTVAVSEHNIGHVFMLADPYIGTANLTPTFSGASNTGCGWVAIGGCVDDAPTVTKLESQHGYGWSQAVSSAVDRLVLEFLMHFGSDSLSTVGAGQTSLQAYNLGGGYGGNQIDWEAGAASVTMSGTFNAGTWSDYFLIELDISPAAVSLVKKVSGATQATVKKIGGVTIATAKKISGVSNT